MGMFDSFMELLGVKPWSQEKCQRELKKLLDEEASLDRFSAHERRRASSSWTSGMPKDVTWKIQDSASRGQSNLSKMMSENSKRIEELREYMRKNGYTVPP